MFGVLVWRLAWQVPPLVGSYASVGFGTLVVLLLEGALYWWAKRMRLGRHLQPQVRLGLLRFLYGLNGVVLLLFPLLVLSGLVGAGPSLQLGDGLHGLVWYLFAVGEFVHYFVWKINMRPAERGRARRRGTRVRARFRRELERLRRTVERQQTAGSGDVPRHDLA